ncbi:nitrogen regulation protein NR(II) [Verrucomicrobiota bacterium]
MTKMRIHEIEISNANIFKILLDSFPDIIHSIDENGNIVYANKTAESLLGYTHDELLSMNIRDIYANEVMHDVEKGFTDLKERGDKLIPESLLKTKDGTIIPVEIRSFGIYDDDGNFIRTFSILRDIRNVKELQRSLAHSGRLAAIGELSSGVAHDINNPLTVILLSNEMMLRELSLIEKDNDTDLQRLLTFAKDIERASKSIQKLADHLRNFSRGIAEKYEPVDLYNSIADALFIINNKIQKTNVKVHNEVKKGKHMITGCPNHMEQVFVNLIGNACDAMADRERKELRLKIGTCKYNNVNCWKCDVSDTGTGIPSDQLEGIFGSFYTTKEKGEGTGLGLSISRGIIRDHKGDIGVTSEVNKGTTFSVILPRISTP